MKITKIKKSFKYLIKKAEFVDGFKTEDISSGMLSIYKNPTSQEIKDAESESSFNSVRGVVLNNNTIYCWNSAVLHDEMPKEYVPDDSFRFACWNGEWIIDLHKHFTFEQGINKFIELRSTLQQFGKFGKLDNITFFYAADDGNKYREFDEDYNYIRNTESNCVDFMNADSVEEFMEIYESDEDYEDEEDYDEDEDF